MRVTVKSCHGLHYAGKRYPKGSSLSVSKAEAKVLVAIGRVEYTAEHPEKYEPVPNEIEEEKKAIDKTPPVKGRGYRRRDVTAEDA